ncbi:MAG: DUF3347 domain-containing protein [Candidatus Riflebacteria bacterium]|nr:DUF3347 domain-containing protein [Candidatus Riflebacteria bacterium]
MTRLITISLVLLGTISSSLAADNPEFDGAMNSIASEYTAIHKAFYGDSTTGVDEAAKKIDELARAIDPSTIEGENAQLFKTLPSLLVGSTAKLLQAKDLAGKRIAFKELSAAMVKWARAAKPQGIHVAFCSMAKARWLQREDKVFNPYYGSSMLHCGTMEDKRSQPANTGHEGCAGSVSGHAGSTGDR